MNRDSRSPALQRWFRAFLASVVAVVVVSLAGLVVGAVTASAVSTASRTGGMIDQDASRLTECLVRGRMEVV